MNSIVYDNRDLSLDIIKIIAMFSVISLHTTCMYDNRDITCQIIGNTSLIAIPLFFITSGYLILSKSTVTFKYVGIKIFRILRYVAVISFLIATAFSFKRGEFSVHYYLTVFCGSFLQKGELWIFWYLGALIMIYLFLPLLHKIYIKSSLCFLIITLLFYVMENIIHTANTICAFEDSIPQTLRIWNWLFYFCLGGILKLIVGKYNNYIKNIPSLSILILWSMFILYTISLNPISWSDKGEYYYNSTPLIVLVIFLFLKLKSCNFKNTNHIISSLSNTFLLVYTIHQFVISFVDHFSFWRIYALGGVINFTLVSIISVSISFVVLRISYINNFFKL